jgi:hypothetical protein
MLIQGGLLRGRCQPSPVPKLRVPCTKLCIPITIKLPSIEYMEYMPVAADPDAVANLDYLIIVHSPDSLSLLSPHSFTVDQDHSTDDPESHRLDTQLHHLSIHAYPRGILDPTGRESFAVGSCFPAVDRASLTSYVQL